MSKEMKKLLLILVAILSVIVVSSCETHEEPSRLNTYDYSLMIVVSRQRLNQDTFVYVLHEANTPNNNG